MRLIRFIAAISVLLLLAACASTNKPDAPLQTIYIVRHAEKATNDPRDPDINAEGQARAQRIAALLQDKDIRTIYVSQFKRTQQTAAPLAKALNITPKILDATPDKNDVYTLTRESVINVRQTLLNPPAGNVLVVGHSNTITSIIEAMGGPTLENISDDDYNGLYRIEIRNGKLTAIRISTQQ